MTWRHIASRPGEGEALPEQGAQPLACHLNHVVAIMSFENERGDTRTVDLTWAMQRRATYLEMTPQDYLVGLIEFSEKAVA